MAMPTAQATGSEQGISTRQSAQHRGSHLVKDARALEATRSVFTHSDRSEPFVPYVCYRFSLPSLVSRFFFFIHNYWSGKVATNNFDACAVDNVLIYFDMRNVSRFSAKDHSFYHVNVHILGPDPPVDNDAVFAVEEGRLSGWTAVDLDLLLTEFTVPGNNFAFFHFLMMFVLSVNCFD